jgi:serpin B
VVAALTVVGVALAGCGSGGKSDAVRLDPDVEFAGVVDPGWRDQAMVDASVRLASELVALGEDDVVVSPLSLQLALAMLREGATGVVADEIDAVAGITGDSQAVADLRAMLAQYEGDVAGIDPDDPPAVPLVHIADSAFVQPGFPVEESFLERVAAYHLAQVFEADFAAGTAKPLLDAWVKEETGGLLDECPATPTPDTRVVLMDAVTFGATWQSQFTAEDTYDGTFTRADGTEVTVPLMHQTLTAAYAAGDGWVAAELPYTEGFAMRVLLPDDGAATVEQWLAAHEALAGASGTELALTMPSWQTDTTLDLTSALGDLGLASLADPAGDLDGVFAGAFVSSIAQGATITVAEKGTVAAAVTAIALGESAAAPPDLELVLDRPFEYQVIEQDTGLVLFAGRVADPS